MKAFSLLLIRIYQHTLSPDHGFMRYFFPHGACRYHPTCSEYTYQAIKLHGFRQGSMMGIKRIGRCHPWAAGGFDPVPPRHHIKGTK